MLKPADGFSSAGAWGYIHTGFIELLSVCASSAPPPGLQSITKFFELQLYFLCCSMWLVKRSETLSTLSSVRSCARRIKRNIAMTVSWSFLFSALKRCSTMAKREKLPPIQATQIEAIPASTSSRLSYEADVPRLCAFTVCVT